MIRVTRAAEPFIPLIGQTRVDATVCISSSTPET